MQRYLIENTVGEVASLHPKRRSDVARPEVSSAKREDYLTGGTVWRASMRSFVRGQGLLDVDEASSAGWYKALMFQPKVIGVLVAAGIAIQRAEWFLALSAILWWNALFPALNPVDALYNTMIAAPPRTPRLGPAPAPRRFAQGMVGTFVLLIGISLLQGWSTTAWIGEALIVIALLDLFFRRFCLGSAVFNRIHRSKTAAAVEETHPA